MKNRIQRAQTFVEYIVLIGVVTSLVVAMSPMVRRGAQSMVKLVADQVGVQREGDQQGGERGYLVNVYTVSEDVHQMIRQDYLGNTTYYPSTFSHRVTDQVSNLGLTEQ